MTLIAAYLICATALSLALCRASTLATTPQDRAQEDREQAECLGRQCGVCRARQ